MKRWCTLTIVLILSTAALVLAFRVWQVRVQSELSAALAGTMFQTALALSAVAILAGLKELVVRIWIATLSASTLIAATNALLLPALDSLAHALPFVRRCCRRRDLGGLVPSGCSACVARPRATYLAAAGIALVASLRRGPHRGTFLSFWGLYGCWQLCVAFRYCDFSHSRILPSARKMRWLAPGGPMPHKANSAHDFPDRIIR